MADTVEYVVRIVGLGGGESEDEKQDSGLTSGLQGLQKAMHPLRTFTTHKKDESTTMLWVRESVKNASDLLGTAVPLEINRYFKLSEDYKSQNYLTNVMSNISKAKSFAGAAVSGMMTGAAAGPVGAVVGAVVGVGVNVATQAIRWNNTVANFNASMNATRVETNYRAKRAGLYNGGKGTEN